MGVAQILTEVLTETMLHQEEMAVGQVQILTIIIAAEM